MPLPYLTRLTLVSLLALQAGCVTVSDGVYEQVEGRYIDHAAYATLAEGKTTPEEALTLFGPAASREALAQGFDQLSWHSLRVRQSITRVGGAVTSRYGASLRETLVLQFYQGRLVHKSLQDDSAPARKTDCKIPRPCQ